MNEIASLGNISVTVTAESVAWYAAIISTFSAIKVLYDIFSEKRRIKISWRDDVSIDKGEILGYDSSKSQFCVEVINTGKRPVKIVNVGYFKKNGDKILFTDSINTLRASERVLTETNPSTSYLTPVDEIDNKNLWYVYALDATGKIHRKYKHKIGRLRRIPVYFIYRKRKKREKK